MSVDSNFYVGPAIIIGNEQVPVTKTIKSCSNKDCTNYLSTLLRWDTYCKKCGTLITDVKYDTTEQRDIESIINENNLDGTIYGDIFREQRVSSVGIFVMNLNSLSVPINIGACDYAVITEPTKEMYMINAKEHEDVISFLALLDAESIEYRFEFIATAYYS